MMIEQMYISERYLSTPNFTLDFFIGHLYSVCSTNTGFFCYIIFRTARERTGEENNSDCLLQHRYSKFKNKRMKKKKEKQTLKILWNLYKMY